MADSLQRRPPPAGWVESLTRSKAQIAAGQTIPLIPVLERLRATAERLEAERSTPEDADPTIKP